MKAYSYLSAEERIRIDELRNRDGLGVRQIAPRTGRTWDNGTESSCHVLVDESLGMLAYFADPYSSYQRGGNENRNGRIRRHLPKRTGFDGLTDADLQAIVQEINGTPMKVLGWETSNEVWYRELGKAMSKTSHPRTSFELTN